jgi:hypothetical protein
MILAERSFMYSIFFVDNPIEDLKIESGVESIS